MSKTLNAARILVSLRQVRSLNLLLDMGYFKLVFLGHSYGIPENSPTAIFLLRSFQFTISFLGAFVWYSRKFPYSYFPLTFFSIHDQFSRGIRMVFQKIPLQLFSSYVLFNSQLVFSGHSYGIPENSSTAIFLLRSFQFTISFLGAFIWYSRKFLYSYFPLTFFSIHNQFSRGIRMVFQKIPLQLFSSYVLFNSQFANILSFHIPNQ